MDTLPGSPTLTRLLSIGSSGKEVIALQNVLNRAGAMPPLSPTGRFGKDTHQALIAFQRKRGLKPDGVVGPGTARALGWNYRNSNAKPYVISYEKPPMPAMSPPLAVIAEVIWDSMNKFFDLIVDDIAHAFDGYRNPYAKRDQINQQVRQRFARYEDLKDDFRRLRKTCDQLHNFSVGQGDLAVAEVKSGLEFFKRDMTSSLRAMDYTGANTQTAIRNIDTLPVQQIVDAVDRVMRGEQMPELAISGIRLAFDAAQQRWVRPQRR